ncbi:S-layer homology domain-containing protein [Paenibacillus sp. GD4]|uniref:S-layer homology domain-containing protein n=1 Tax=Paenibacillus sp. GD4 TaxID=3068890 RepID=UPI002796753A|nr:S-layer homology domain-containing protein [Paenibacillus sp. GD4]MDQ1912651.1 S-layer homology domain-containing protein [Paenibacillus sp. GD4]
MSKMNLKYFRAFIAVLLFSAMMVNASTIKGFAASALTVQQTIENNRAEFKVTDTAASNDPVTIVILQKQTNSLVFADQASLAGGAATFITLLPKGDYTGFVGSASSNKVNLQDFSIVKEESIVGFRPLKAIAVAKGASVVLPSSVIAIFDDGANREVGVQWTHVPSTDVSGQFTAIGKVNGSSETVRLSLQVGESNTGGGDNGGGDNGGGNNGGGNNGGGNNGGGNNGGGDNGGGNNGGGDNGGGDNGGGNNGGGNNGGGDNGGGNNGGGNNGGGDNGGGDNGGGASGGGSNGGANQASITVTPKLDRSTTTAKAEIAAAVIDSAFANAATDIKGIRTVTINLDKVDGAKAYEPTLPASVLVQGDKKQIIKVNTPIGSVELPGNMVKASSAAAGTIISVPIEAVDKSFIADPKLRDAIGDRPIIELNLKVDGKLISWANKDAAVKVSVKYTPKPEEIKNNEHIVIWYIDGAGKAVKVPNAKYNAAAGTVTFTTTHFSQYAISYDFKTFDDAGIYPWAQVPIEVLASKGIINGVSATAFNPAEKITRADFLLLLVKTLGISADFSDNFSDVSPSDYYYEALGIAKQLGIANGTGANVFHPMEYISRQDLMVLSARALKIAGMSTNQGSAEVIQKFSDQSSVASYAVEDIRTMVKEGIVTGDGNLLHPQDNATRAETAAILYRIFKKQ